jgi:PilZ domain
MVREQTVLEIVDDTTVPDEVCLLCSALETGQHAASERRAHKRRPYRTAARLRLFTDTPDAEPTLLYTRDVDPRGIGFVTQHRLPLGYGGRIELRSPQGNILRVHGTLIRCRPAAPGWYEGALSLNRQQPEFG